MADIFPRLPVLFVDDENDVLETYSMAMKLDGINNFVLFSDSRNVMSALHEKEFCAAVIDLSMPHVSGMQLLEEIRQTYPGIPVIVVTGSNDVGQAVECMKKGAFDYMLKPVENNRLTSSIRRAVEIGDLRNEVNTLKEQILADDVRHPGAFAQIITVSRKMKSLFKYIEAIAGTPRPVLITGESGVGKELVARAIHTLSGRSGNFVAVNVGGLDDTMFSDTLFGHKKGAFTGADANRPGLIEQAKGGTLFLDEIGDMDKTTQVKLLRLLQDREYYQLGSDAVKISDARIVTATNMQLEEKQKNGSFRTDLYFRLITHLVEIPPLKERKEDIPHLVGFFIRQAAESISRKAPEVPEELYALLSVYHFPGNIRELQAIIFDAVSCTQGDVLALDTLKEYLNKRIVPELKSGTSLPGESFSITYAGRFPKLKEIEDFLFDEAMKIADGNQSVAASFLGVNQSTLSRHFKDKKVII